MYSYRSPSQPREEMPPWLASLVLKQGGGALARFAVHYQRLASMPRAWRQRLRRKLAVSLSSAALIMALAGPVALPIAAAPAAPEATIVVVDGEVADVHNNKCSLIEAIINARTNKAGQLRADCTAGNLNGPDTISLPAGGLFELTAAHNEQFGPTGLPVITSAMTIEGNGATIRRSDVSGTPVFRILAVDDAGSLTLRNVVIENGDTGWRFEGPGGYQGGGAILNKNSLTLTGVQVSNSRTWLYGGAIYAEPGSVTTITDSLIATNVVWDDYGEGGGLFLAGQATISGTTITNNTAAYSGGIEVARNGEVTIRDSLVSMNVANADYGGAGGGIGITGVAAIIDSTIADNFAAGGMDYGGYGGGMAVSGVATISGSTIVGNSATSGGEYGPGAPFDGPGEGGGVRVWGTAHISNTTISGNDANRGGGVWSSGELTLTHSTVTGNVGRRQTNEYDGYTDTQPGIGGGLYLTARYATSNVTTLRGAIISGNTADDGGPQVLIDPSPDSDYVPTVNRDAFNVFGQNGNAGLVGLSKGASDIVPSVGLTAILSPLADNGGPTQTHALPAGSPALDLAPNASCTAAPVNGVDQRGEPRNQNGKGGATNNECDAGAFERSAAVAQMGFYLSTTAAGSVGGVAFAPGDILKFTPAGGWSMHFDASDVGITKNVVAVEIEANGDILLSLAAAQNVPGVGNVQPQDVIRFTPTSTGPTTAGAFTMALDGSANLLTTSGEKIDALARTDGRIALSTVGAAAVKRPDNSVLKAQDEDALGFNLTTGQWSEFFNGTAIPGLAAEDVNALWIDPATGDLYISIVGAFNLGGVAGDGRDIVKLTPSGAPGGYTPSLFWDGSANGFPTNIDGLEMIP